MIPEGGAWMLLEAGHDRRRVPSNVANAKNRNPKKVTNIATPEPQATNSGNIAAVAARRQRRNHDAERINRVVDCQSRSTNHDVADKSRRKAPISSVRMSGRG